MSKARCKFYSLAYGGQCEKKKGHKGSCVTEGDAFVGSRQIDEREVTLTVKNEPKVPTRILRTVTVQVDIVLDTGTVSVNLSEDSFIVSVKNNVLKTRPALITVSNAMYKALNEAKEKFHNLLFK